MICYLIMTDHFVAFSVYLNFCWNISLEKMTRLYNYVQITFVSRLCPTPMYLFLCENASTLNKNKS